MRKVLLIYSASLTGPMRLLALVLTLCVCSTYPTVAQTVTLSNPVVSVTTSPDGPVMEAKVTLSWPLAWRDATNHDAAWVFVRAQSSNGSSRPVRLGAGAIRVVDQGIASAVPPAFSIPEDSLGFFVYPSAAHRGPIHWTLAFPLDPSSLGRTNPSSSGVRWSVHGLEMVFIPEGSFYVGGLSEKAQSYSAFFQSDAAGQPADLFQVTSEAAIPVGPRAGALFYNEGQYRGDAEGPIPATFPKGYAGFYIMKYELTQGQYATFLNHLRTGATHFRANISGRDYYRERGTIRLENGRYVAGAPKRAANFISWDDAMAFTDWAGLRPLTELEFTKAARGPERPELDAFPWGTNTTDRLIRYANDSGDPTVLTGFSLGEMTFSNRDQFGASFYGVMDLAGGMWERVITVGHPTGRAFVGTHGDGLLTGEGFATNSDWPKGYDDEGGFGYRGGGYYGPGLRHTDFNPYSPVSYRPFGSWAGWVRALAYGYRAARSAP